MSDQEMTETEFYADWKKYKQERKKNNFHHAIGVIEDSQIFFKQLSDTHLRILEWDFWPSTGLYIHTKTKKRGRGVYNLMKLIEKKLKK